MKAPDLPNAGSSSADAREFVEAAFHYLVFRAALYQFENRDISTSATVMFHREVHIANPSWCSDKVKCTVRRPSSDHIGESLGRFMEFPTIPTHRPLSLHEWIVMASSFTLWELINLRHTGTRRHSLNQQLAALATMAYWSLEKNDLEIRLIKSGLELALTESASALGRRRRSPATGDSRGLSRSRQLFLHPATAQELLASVYVAACQATYEAAPEGVNLRLWCFSKVVEFICAKEFNLRVLCEFYGSAKSGDLLVIASSRQSFPSSPPKPFSGWVVPRSQLTGGAAVATQCVLPNDRPDALTNSNDDVEGSPRRTVAIPVTIAGMGQGQMFVSVYGSPKRWSKMGGVLAVVFEIGMCAGPGASAESMRNSLRKNIATKAAFQDALKYELAKDPGANGSARLGIAVVSAPRASSVDSEPDSVARLRDAWARFTCLRVSESSVVYRLGHASYAFIKRRLSEREWEEWRDRRGVQVTEATRADGAPFATLGIWIVPWREDLRSAAKARMTSSQLQDLIERQVRFSAQEVVALNSMQRAIQRGHYGTAYNLARLLVDTRERGSDCGVAIHELIRMALVIGNFDAARIYSERRMLQAPWDIEGHLNYLLSCVAVGDLVAARNELSSCEICSRRSSAARSSPYGSIYSMMEFTRALIPWLMTPTLKKRREQLSRAIASIARESGSGFRVERALNVIALWKGGEIERVRTALGMIEEQVDDFRHSERDSGGSLQQWWEIAGLRRLVSVLRGYLFHTTGEEPTAASAESRTLETTSTTRRTIALNKIATRTAKKTLSSYIGLPEVDPASVKGTIDFGIITITPEEYLAVGEKFTADSATRAEHTYRLGRLRTLSGALRTFSLVRAPEVGGLAAQRVANHMISDIDPHWLVLVGMAGAVPSGDWSLGDVLCAKRLHDFSVRSVTELETQFSNLGAPPHVDVEDLIMQLPLIERDLVGWHAAIETHKPTFKIPAWDSDIFYGGERWQKKVRESLLHHFPKGVEPRPPRVRPGSTAVGDVLVKNASLAEAWIEHSRDISIIEMELAGVFSAARRRRPYPVLAIRGISDVVGLRREDVWKQYACEAAAAWAWALLRSDAIPKREK